MKIQVIAIGDELLLGQVTDTNSGFIARSLDPIGWRLEKVNVIHDNKADIISEIERSLLENDITITTGGLGPTRDDITKSTLMEIFGGEPVLHKPSLDNIIGICTRRGIEVNDLTHNQAIVPSSCQVIVNCYGTAPVMWFERKGKVLVSLPGVPHEMQHCWIEEVLPRLVQKYMPQTFIIHKVYIVTGITESALAELLSGFEDALPKEIHLAYLPKSPYIRLRMDGISDNKEKLSDMMDRLEEQLLKIAGEYVIYKGDTTPQEMLSELLRVNKLSLSVAESCTGGAIAASITAIPGSSNIFKGGVVAYSNYVKESVLKVNANILKERGAVSEEVVKQMGKGIQAITGSSCAIATSGIAGPAGGTPEKPVGTVWTAVAYGNQIRTRLYHFTGTRDRIIERTVATTLLDLYSLIKTEL